MRPLLRFLSLAAFVALAACKRSHAAPKPAIALAVAQRPIASTLPALPTPAAMIETMSPELGTWGDLTIEDRPRTVLVGARSSDGTFHPHEPIAAASVGAHGEWILALAASGLFLVEGDALAVRARLFRDASGDVASSPDGLVFAFGTCAGNRCGVDVRAFPDLRRIRFVETDEASRIRFSQDGTELAVVSRSESSVTIVDVATGTTEHYDSTGAVNDACFIGKRAIAYGNDDDTTIVVDRTTKAKVLDHLAYIGHGVRRDQNAVAYDAARDRLYTGGNDNDVWPYDGPASGSPRALSSHEFDNDVSDFVLLPNGDLVVALDSASLDVLHPDGTKGSLIGFSVGSVSYGARVSLGKNGDVVGVLGHVIFRWKIGEAQVRQAPLFAHFAETTPLSSDSADYLRIPTNGSIAWVPSSGDPLRVTTVDLGVPAGRCELVHDGLACSKDDPTPEFHGAPTGALAFAALPLPADVVGPLDYARVVDGYLVTTDKKRHVIAIDAHHAKIVGDLPPGAYGIAVEHDAKRGWTVHDAPLKDAKR